MRIPQWGIFYDFHTMPTHPEVGKDFDCDAIAEQIKRCGADFVVFPARCNLGTAYYNTQLGIRHASLEYDLLLKLAEAMHKRDIQISAYINAGLSHEEGLLHREWTTVTPDGRAYAEPMEGNHFFRRMCYNSGYAEHLLGMVGELLEYPIDGFFFDCFSPAPCIGVECIREMRKLNMDVNAFADFTRLRFARRLSERIKGSGKDYLIYFNGVPFEDQLDLATYLEYECLPTGGWGYESLQFNARRIRTLGMPVLNMTGRFHESWGDFGGIRTRASLIYDCLTGLGNAMRTTIGDHFHPRGDMNMPVYDLIADIYGELTPLQPWLNDAAAVTDIAVVLPAKTFVYNSESGARTQQHIQAGRGACRMLIELKKQFDVISADQDFSKYKMLILLDQLRLDAELTARIQDFIAAGGKIIASGWSGLRQDAAQFALPEAWGVEFIADSPHDPAYFSIREKIDGVPDMPVTLYDKGTAVKAISADIVADIIAPYFNRHFDQEHAYLYLPPNKADGTAALTINAQVAHFSHPIGISYFNHAQVPLRNLLGSVIDKLLPQPLLKVENLPSYGRATVTTQDNRRIVWLTAYVPERRGAKIDMIEEGSIVQNVKLALRTDGLKISKVYTAPDRKPVEFEIKDDYCHISPDQFTGYTVIVFES